MDKESILVVDDDVGFLELTKIILQKEGYQVKTVPTAGEAMSCVKESFYNAAILDISLPDIKGTELLPIILEENHDIMVIMLTGHSSVQNAVQSLNNGAFSYLEKPLDPKHLLSVIARGLEKQRLVFENRHLVEELERRNRDISTLLAVSQGVSQSLDLQHILNSALEKVAEAMEVEAGFLYLLENNRLVLKGYYGFTTQTAEEMKFIEVDDGVISRVSKQGKPIVIRKAAADAEPNLVSLKKLGYQSYACVQLAAPGEPLGVMGVATCLEHNFSTRDIELLNAIGREVSIAVRNAKLYEEASSAKALRELDALRTELLANVSHELRTPLAAIKGFASALLQPDVSFDEETMREFLQTIDSEADRLNLLIEELLVMTRIEAGTLEVRKEWYSIAEIIESIKDRLCALASKRRLRILIHDGLPKVEIDDRRIGEVLTNLVDNAVKYSQEGSQITLEAQPNGKELILSVADEGTGIPPELHKKVFERFYRVNDDTVVCSRGAGLGLSVCRGIVEAHGGRIWVESIPGKGSKFNFSLPTNGKRGE